jgi:hypothetical protein
MGAIPIENNFSSIHVEENRVDSASLWTITVDGAEMTVVEDTSSLRIPEFSFPILFRNKGILGET